MIKHGFALKFESSNKSLILKVTPFKIVKVWEMIERFKNLAIPSYSFLDNESNLFWYLVEEKYVSILLSRSYAILVSISHTTSLQKAPSSLKLFKLFFPRLSTLLLNEMPGAKITNVTYLRPCFFPFSLTYLVSNIILCSSKKLMWRVSETECKSASPFWYCKTESWEGKFQKQRRKTFKRVQSSMKKWNWKFSSCFHALVFIFPLLLLDHIFYSLVCLDLFLYL